MAQLPDFAQPLENLVRAAASATGNLIGATNDGKATLSLLPVASLDDPDYTSFSDQIEIVNVAWKAIFLILESCRKFGVTDRAQIAYILATAGYEAKFGAKNLVSTPGHNWMYEYPWFKSAGQTDKDYFNNEYHDDNGNGSPSSGDGFKYRGRGYAHLTWKDNYSYFGNLFNVDLVNHPELAAETNLAADILVKGMKDGLFTGNSLSRYIQGDTSQFVQARAILAGVGGASEIAKMAEKYFATLNSLNYA
ncbi:MAG: hypothetical protein IM470_11805 [Microcystis sp. M158S2]|nr:hypothetical protein [Microcystis sp. M158S2]